MSTSISTDRANLNPVSILQHGNLSELTGQRLMKALITILIILLVLLQFKLWFGDGSLREVWRLEAAIEEQRQQNAQLRERNTALEAEVQDLKKGLEAIEERARSELGMIKKGETFYQIVDEEDSVQPPPQE